MREKSAMSNIRYYITVVIMSVALSTGEVMAADWGLEVILPAGVEHTDNLYMATTDEQEETIFRFRPELGLVGESDNNMIDLTVGIQLERYKSEDVLNRNDPFVELGWDHFMERSIFGVSFRREELSTRTSELEETGRVDIFGTRRNEIAEAHWSGELNDRNSLSLGAEYSDVVYDVPSATSPYIDYRDAGLHIGYGHHWDTRTTFSVDVNGSRYNADAVDLDYNYGSVTAGVDYQATEQLSYGLSAGGGYLVREVGENSTTWLVNASVNAEREFDTTTFEFTSDLRPSGEGDIRRIYALRMGYVRALSSRFDLTFDIGLTRSSAFEEADPDWNDMLTIEPGFDYLLLEELTLEGWYRYRESQYDRGSDTSIENAVYIGIRYAPERISLR